VPFFYGGRPFIVRPKKLVPMEIVNLVCVLLWDMMIYRYFGASGVVFLILSSLFGMGINPCAIHVIAEHFEFVKGQETFSYYGPFNTINFNLGYHVEHHDFPWIPWTKLP